MRVEEMMDIQTAMNDLQGLREQLPPMQEVFDLALDALALMQKQEQGLVVELPCRVGDTVYAHVPEFMRIGKFQVDMVQLDGHKNIDFEANWAEHGELMADLDFEPNDIGKTVFLTRALAEEMLKNVQKEI